MKVSELTGAQLDWAVAKVENANVLIEDGTVGFERLKGNTWGSRYIELFTPSANWAQGGPIIEREGIDLYCNVPTNPSHEDVSWRGSWRAKYHRCGRGSEIFYGPTALIAAMRCYVTSKLGNDIELPEELK